MSGEDLKAIAEAIGWPLAIALFVGWVLAKNGWIKVIMRDERGAEVQALRTRVESLGEENARLWKHNAIIKRSIAEVEKDVAVLMDRWEQRKD